MKKKFEFTFQSSDETIYKVEGDSYEDMYYQRHYTDRLISITKL